MRLEEILKVVTPELDEVEVRLRGWAEADSPVVAEAVGHLIRSGGKRLRPACLLLAARLGGAREPHPPSPKTIELAAAVEIIHMASLIHDDIIDRADVRRGRASVPGRWGQAFALLAGDLLYSRVFRDMTRNGQGEALGAVAEAVHRMVLGELAETVRRDDLSLSEAEYLKIVGDKTASLFACATYLGARAGGLSEEEARRLRRYGEQLGVAFQIVDDLLDLCQDEQDLGKPTGADLRDGKVTLPVIHALGEDRRRGSSRVADLFVERNGPELRATCAGYGSLDYAARTAEGSVRSALACLEGLPGGPGLDGLADVAKHVSSRGRDAVEHSAGRPARSLAVTSPSLVL